MVRVDWWGVLLDTGEGVRGAAQDFRGWGVEKHRLHMWIKCSMLSAMLIISVLMSLCLNTYVRSYVSSLVGTKIY